MVRLALEGAVERGEIESSVDIVRSAKLLEAAYFTTMIVWLRAGVPDDMYRDDLTETFDIIFRGLGMAGLGRKG